MMTDQFECAFVTGFRDKTRRICHIYAIHYNWKKDFEVNCLYKTRWDSYPGIGEEKKSFLLKNWPNFLHTYSFY
jgi:hypothetical protein